MTFFEEEQPKKPTAHEIGCDLSMLSVDELQARIALMRDEISRLEIEISAKSDSRNAAESLFKK